MSDNYAPGTPESLQGDAGFPADMWANEDVRDAASALWDGVRDVADDGKLSEGSRSRMTRALRTLAQGVGGAVLAGAVPVAIEAIKGDPTNLAAAASAFGTAALAAVVAYFHTRKPE